MNYLINPKTNFIVIFPSKSNCLIILSPRCRMNESPTIFTAIMARRRWGCVTIYRSRQDETHSVEESRTHRNEKIRACFNKYPFHLLLFPLSLLIPPPLLPCVVTDVNSLSTPQHLLPPQSLLGDMLISPSRLPWCLSASWTRELGRSRRL